MDNDQPRTVVVNLRSGPYDVYIGRGAGERGPWGNPYQIGRDGDRTQVIALYRQWIMQQPHLLALLPTLRGKRLGCFCKPAACHGDVLAALADAIPTSGAVQLSLF